MINKVHEIDDWYYNDYTADYYGGGTREGDANVYGIPYAVGYKKGKLKYYGYGTSSGRGTSKGHGTG